MTDSERREAGSADAPAGRDMEPLSERPGYNAKPTDWVRYANHLEAEVERLRAAILATVDRLAKAAFALQELRYLAWSLLKHIDQMVLCKAQQRALDEPVAALRAALASRTPTEEGQDV